MIANVMAPHLGAVMPNVFADLIYDGLSCQSIQRRSTEGAGDGEREGEMEGRGGGETAAAPMRTRKEEGK